MFPSSKSVKPYQSYDTWFMFNPTADSKLEFQSKLVSCPMNPHEPVLNNMAIDCNHNMLFHIIDRMLISSCLLVSHETEETNILPNWIPIGILVHPYESQLIQSYLGGSSNMGLPRRIPIENMDDQWC